MIASYDDALRQTSREARATLVCAAAIAVFFGAAIFLLKDAGLGPAGLPLWFWAAVVGGYLLSVVLLLVKKVFRDFSLDLRPEECCQSAGADARTGEPS